MSGGVASGCTAAVGRHCSWPARPIGSLLMHSMHSDYGQTEEQMAQPGYILRLLPLQAAGANNAKNDEKMAQLNSIAKSTGPTGNRAINPCSYPPDN